MANNGGGDAAPRGRAILGSGNKMKMTTKSSLSVTAPEFIPRGLAGQTYLSEVNIGARGDGTDSLPGPVSRLEGLIQTLTANPAFYEEGLEKVAQDFGNSIKDEKTLLGCIEKIVDQCVDEANFRYIGARMCQAFSTEIKVEFPTGNFRQHLMKRVHAEHIQRDEMAKTPSGRKRLVGLTMFMGELLRHMTVGHTKNRIEVLATAVQELAVTCLDNPEELTIKNTIHVMKLCGPMVHQIEKKSNSENKTPKLDAVFSRLKHLAVDDKWSRNLRETMLNLIEQHMKWDDSLEEPALETIGKSPSAQPQSPPYSDVPFTNEPVFYNLAGQVITAEEAGFGGEAVYGEEYTGYDPYTEQEGFSPDALENYIEGDMVEQDSGEWNDEIDAAYEVFLVNQQNAKHTA